MGMESFEQFRKKTAETVKNVPKGARRTVLEEIKKEDPQKYDEAKKLHEAKRQTSMLSKTETLTNPENPEEVLTWIKTEIENFMEEQDYYVESYRIQDILKDIVKYLAKRLNIKIGQLDENEIIKNSSEVIEDENKSVDEYRVNGNFALMGNQIFEYSSRNDSSGFDIESWHDENLRTAITQLIEYLKSQNR